MTSSRHIEFLGYLPDGTRVPNANSSSDCVDYHTRTIGPKRRIRKALWTLFCAVDETT